jgi:hypothetical protein
VLNPGGTPANNFSFFTASIMGKPVSIFSQTPRFYTSNMAKEISVTTEVALQE